MQIRSLGFAPRSQSFAFGALLQTAQAARQPDLLTLFAHPYANPLDKFKKIIKIVMSKIKRSYIMANYNGNSLLSGIYAGLTNTYSYLASKNPDGVTLDSITKARTDTTSNQYLNPTFASYLQTNFGSIDKDGDGIISSDEMSNLTNRMSAQGLTKEELTQMYASGASGLSTDTINNILEHFDEMDTNHDGRITSAEISAYSVNSARMEKEDEFNNKFATDMSVFYGSESSSTDGTYSMLSYKYKSSNSNS